jgi:tRNA threonylcarbamoyladenosine biosynthesis protein TsaB
MITLAIDTSERRGSVAVRQDGRVVASRQHGDEDYSSWLLPVVEGVLVETGTKMDFVELLAVSTGPGSFTGVRVGLTSVKAWAEVYGNKVVGVSRLEAVAKCSGREGYVAASYDAYRGQVFAALYRWENGKLVRIESEMVSAPEEFVGFVEKRVGAATVQWVTLDPQLITATNGWSVREKRGDELITCSPKLAGVIGEIAEERAQRREYTDVLQLDANYVRRSDAEIFWKGPASGVR